MFFLCRPPPRFKVAFNPAEDRVNAVPTSVSNGISQYTGDHPFHASLISNERLTSDDHWQDVRLIRLDIEGSGIK